MIKDGTAKRADAMKFRIEDIHEEPGFNLRDVHAVDKDGVSFDDSIDALAAYIADGGIVPPLEVRPRTDGGVFVVDGHRRRLAYIKVSDQLRDGNGELWISVVPFTGNDADRVARIITSAEGRSLSMLEVAKGYKRLASFGWTPQQIADKVGKTRQHVDQALILANANSDVHQLVTAGTVSATAAIEVVRKHGEDAGKVLTGEADKAKAAGKKKVTAATMKGKPLPRALTDELAETTAQLIASLPIEAHETMATMKLSDTSAEPVVTVCARKLWELLAVNNAIGEEREKQAAKLREAQAAANQGDIEDAA
ncbi:MAG TPA: ParB N-terminal domain-containing protein [Pyrinomonadaceae bacterium]|nr:ParB N-terminal domain-containing protein [Pyrinomonadaceae bacterium]